MKKQYIVNYVVRGTYSVPVEINVRDSMPWKEKAKKIVKKSHKEIEEADFGDLKDVDWTMTFIEPSSTPAKD